MSVWKQRGEGQALSAQLPAERLLLPRNRTNGLRDMQGSVFTSTMMGPRFRCFDVQIEWKISDQYAVDHRAVPPGGDVFPGHRPQAGPDCGIVPCGAVVLAGQRHGRFRSGLEGCVPEDGVRASNRYAGISQLASKRAAKHSAVSSSHAPCAPHAPCGSGDGMVKRASRWPHMAQSGL